jgi:prepilin signal peptidase PulO-like enzyme (type II secretory pathway)
MTDHKIYTIPARFRRIENMHILLWLIKDACWAMNYRTVGMIMIIPTLLVALFITWQTRHILSEFLHNLAVVFWISANCTWMIGEFYGWDENLWGEYGLRQMSLIPFGIGLMILLYYYLFLASKKSFRDKMFAKTEEAVKEELAD